jgi:hypothetical protein
MKVCTVSILILKAWGFLEQWIRELRVSEYTTWHYFHYANEGSVVCIVTRVGTGWSGVWILVEMRFFFSPSKMSRPGVGLMILLFSMYWDSFPGAKQLRCEVNCSPPSSAEVKSEWSYTFILLVCLYGMDGENVILLKRRWCWIRSSLISRHT